MFDIDTLPQLIRRDIEYGEPYIPERTQFIFRTIGIEKSYWPRYLRHSL